MKRVKISKADEKSFLAFLAKYGRRRYGAEESREMIREMFQYTFSGDLQILRGGVDHIDITRRGMRIYDRGVNGKSNDVFYYIGQ